MEQEEKKPGWWGRNWKWFVPLGCLTSFLLFAGFLALIFSIVFGMLKSSPSYQEALTKAKSNPAVIQKLGEPIMEGFLLSGNVNESGPTGHANLAIPISGPKGKATLFVEAQKSLGEWKTLKIILEFQSDGQRIDLLENDGKTE